MSKKRKTTDVGTAARNDVKADIHRRRLEINLGVIRVDFKCKELNEEQRKQLQKHALKEETRSLVDKRYQNFYSIKGGILPPSELVQTFCLANRDAHKALGVSYRTYQDALKWYGIKKVAPSTAISIRNGEDCFSPEKKKEKGLAEDACPERTYVWFCLLSLKDRGYVNDQNATNIRNREKLKNIETDFSDGNGGKLNQFQLDKQRYNKSTRCTGERCPLGKPCPGCETERSKMWALIPQTTERFVQIGKEKGYNVRTDFVKRFWVRRSPGLSEEMFDEDKTRRGMVCSDCFHSALKLWSGFVGATRINIPIR